MVELSPMPADALAPAPAKAAAPAVPPVVPPSTRPPTLASRAGKYALIVGLPCAAIGAVEGAIVGSILAPREDAGTVLLAVAFDRCLLLGLLGAVLGAVVGVWDWRSRVRRKA